MKNITNKASRYFGLKLSKDKKIASLMLDVDEFVKTSKKIFLLNENWFIFALSETNDLFLSRQVVGYVPGVSGAGFSFLDFEAENYNVYPLGINSIEEFVWEKSHFAIDKIHRVVWEIIPNADLAHSNYSLQISNS